MTRSENKPHILAMLAEEYKIKRRKQSKVSIQITVISWSVEFLAGILSISAIYLAMNLNKNVGIIVGITIFDIILNFIAIPSTYVFNTEVNKTGIIDEGWCNIFVSCFQSNRVQSIANNNNRPNQLYIQ